MELFKKEQRTKQRLLEHCLRYPNLQIEDLFKYIFQSAFGCEHMVSSADAAVDWICREYGAGGYGVEIDTEPLDGGYSRAHLCWLDRGLAPKTLGALFCRSAKAEANGREALVEKLNIAREMIEAGELPFELSAFEEKRLAWEREGYAALHHSSRFRESYHPAYRVVANDYARFLPLFAKIDEGLQNGNLTLAVEGGSASGKTTLASMLREVYDCAVFHMDDFFLRPEQRTAERFAEAGGNVDRERFLEEVLLPLQSNAPVSYRPFDCSTQTLKSAVTVAPRPLTVIEGAYSMHPELASHYDLSVYLDIDAEYQRARILKRNSPQFARLFFDRWIPMETAYFSETGARARCDLVIPIVDEG